MDAVEYLKQAGTATASEVAEHTGLPIETVYEQLVRAESQRIATVYVSYKLRKPVAIWEDAR
jgi:DNA-binding IclR family transcriptional regulator